MVRIHADSRETKTFGEPPVIDIRVGIPEFFDAGACRPGAPTATWPEVFFPTPREASKTAEAKALCSGCPVREKCLTWALENREPHGIWGGLTERERRQLLHRMDGVVPDKPERVCALHGCEVVIPAAAHRNQKFCTPKHAKRHSDNAYTARGGQRKKEPAA